MTTLQPTTFIFEPLNETPLSKYLDSLCEMEKRLVLCLCGDPNFMTREYVNEPMNRGWSLARSYVHQKRTATYRRGDYEIIVKLVNWRDGWFPGCENLEKAIWAWRLLQREYKKRTGLQLLTSPAATGKALLWATLPRGHEYHCLEPDLAHLIRANSPQHRIEWFRTAPVTRAEQNKFLLESAPYSYDGRFFYGALTGLDRFPAGEAQRSGGFMPYTPGWHRVDIKIPVDWSHLGLIPVKADNGDWVYPSEPGAVIEKVWVSEPELTLAINQGWAIIEHYDGYSWSKGRPLGKWSDTLTKSYQELLNAKFDPSTEEPDGELFDEGEILGLVAKAFRQIHNHTIGSLHVDGYEREVIIPKAAFQDWRRRHPWADFNAAEAVPEGWRVSEYVPNQGRLDIYMPHWSAQVWALARARVAEYALKVSKSSLVYIHGDAIYTDVPAPWVDNSRLGQLRRKDG